MVSLPSEGSRKDPEIYQGKYILGPPSWTLTEKTNYISDFGEIYRKKKKVQSHEDYGRTKYMECRICQSSWSLSEMTK